MVCIESLFKNPSISCDLSICFVIMEVWTENCFFSQVCLHLPVEKKLSFIFHLVPFPFSYTYCSAQNCNKISLKRQTMFLKSPSHVLTVSCLLWTTTDWVTTNRSLHLSQIAPTVNNGDQQGQTKGRFSYFQQFWLLLSLESHWGQNVRCHLF